jgi:hypothetical protein
VSRLRDSSLLVKGNHPHPDLPPEGEGEVRYHFHAAFSVEGKAGYHARLGVLKGEEKPATTPVSAS